MQARGSVQKDVDMNEVNLKTSRLSADSPAFTYDGFVNLNRSSDGAFSGRDGLGTGLASHGFALDYSPGGTLRWRTDAVLVAVSYSYRRACDPHCAVDMDRKKV